MNGTVNMTMHHQWASRPDDERFGSAQDMRAMLAALHTRSATRNYNAGDLEVVPMQGFGASGGRTMDLADRLTSRTKGTADQTVAIQTRTKQLPALLTAWSFNQLCSTTRLGADTLRLLPPVLVADCLNYGLSKIAAREDHQLYFDLPDVDAEPRPPIVRALTSPGYTRIHTLSILDKVIELQDRFPSWKAPEVYTRGDFGGKQTPCIGYAGDRDAYICLQDEEHRIPNPSDPSGQGMMRGLMIVNSEVGSKRLDVILFACAKICGNFMIWDFKQIASLSMRHFGQRIRDEWSRSLGRTFYDYANSSSNEETELVTRAARKELGPTKESIIDLLFKKGLSSKRDTADAYDLAVRYEPNPRTIWGVSQGLTRLSQLETNQDKRIERDRAAAKILNLANDASLKVIA